MIGYEWANAHPKISSMFTYKSVTLILQQNKKVNFIKENLELCKTAAINKNRKVDIDKILTLDDERRDLIQKIQLLREERNKLARQGKPHSAEASRGRQIKEELKKYEDQLSTNHQSLNTLLSYVPNVPLDEVPVGADESGNVEVKQWGKIPKFDFELKSHLELGLSLDLFDLERGSKVSGFRGYFLKNEGVLLSYALWQYANDVVMKEGFQPMMVPALVRPDPFFGTGYLPQGEEDLYKTQDGDFLSGTAEVGTMGYFMDETLPFEHLPVKYVSFSPCFRREAGSHGKDTKGLIRLHEFYKVEQVVICEANHEESVRWHEAILANAEKIMQGLKIPYRVVNCTGDLGQGQVKKYDIEAWVPSENKYRETHSISYFHDFQTRRLNLKYRDKEGKTRLAHSLNGTALASPRILVPLLENYQQADGTVIVPEVLRPYLGGREVIR